MALSTFRLGKHGFETSRTANGPGVEGPVHFQIDCGGPVTSVYDAAWEEAHRHKWIESQKHGRDLGDAALKDWFRKFFLPFCRQRRLEHVEGSRPWLEFAEQEFGQVYELILQGDLLLDRILDRMEHGFDNLEIINWALAWGLQMGRVLELLEMIDINRARLEPIAFER
jgi:hypothetical protein